MRRFNNFNTRKNKSKTTYIKPDVEVVQLRKLGIDISETRINTFTLEIKKPADETSPISKYINKNSFDSSKIFKRVGIYGGVTIHFYTKVDRDSFKRAIEELEKEIKLKNPQYKIGQVATDNSSTWSSHYNDYFNIDYKTVHQIFKDVLGEWSSDEERTGTHINNTLF